MKIFEAEKYNIRENEDNAEAFEKLFSIIKNTSGEKILRFYWQYDKRCSWFNGETYIDTLNEDAVQKFVEVTHEQYRKHIGEYFGSVVPGIFSDEPCYSHFNVTGLPWSFKVPEEFQKEYGCSLLEHLPELFFHYGEEVNLSAGHIST